MTLYRGPLDFYWHTYSRPLLFLLIVLTFMFGARYRQAKMRIYARAANAFGNAGLGMLVLIMTVDAIESGTVAPIVVTVTFVSLFAWTQSKLS